jgi:hypothetical protein
MMNVSLSITVSQKNRVLPCRTRVSVLKDERQGVMVSAFQNREFGFSFIMSPEQLQQVNNARRGKKYKDKEVAISRLGTAHKKTSMVQAMKVSVLSSHGYAL